MSSPRHRPANVFTVHRVRRRLFSDCAGKRFSPCLVTRADNPMWIEIRDIQSPSSEHVALPCQISGILNMVCGSPVRSGRRWGIPLRNRPSPTEARGGTTLGSSVVGGYVKRTRSASCSVAVLPQPGHTHKKLGRIDTICKHGTKELFTAMLNKTFEVPEWVEIGVESGTHKIFGGVVRDNAGKIVHFLRESTSDASVVRDRRVLIGIGVVVVVSAAAYYAYRKLSKRESMLAQLKNVEKSSYGYLESAKNRRLSLQEVRQLASDIQKLIKIMEQSNFVSINDPDALQKLRDFHTSVRNFNLQLQDGGKITANVPPALETDSVTDLTRQLLGQLRFQEHHWPAEA